MANNKVKFGLSRVHYSMVTETESDGVVTSSYGTLKPLAGAVSLSLSSTGAKSVFRADNSDYFVSYGEGGFDGSLEVARVNEDFLKDVLGLVEDDNNILVESSSSFKQTKYFAMVFEFDGDQKATKHCLYKVSAARPDIASQTTGEGGSTDPQTETLNLDSTDAAVIAAWYTAIPVPTFTP